MPKPDIFDSISGIIADLHLEGISPLTGSGGGDKDIFAPEKRKAWARSGDSRCDFDFRPRISPRAGIWFTSLWKKSLMGRTLEDIKSDPAEIRHFADAVSDFLMETLGQSLDNGTWCVCTTPKRRHKVNNFATAIAAEIAGILRIPFYEDVAVCKNRQRVNPVFSLVNIPEEPNVILFDDFVTTGSTLAATAALLREKGKTLHIIAGINNS